jgi:hypothetical protein
MNLSGIILALFMQITMHHHTFLDLGDCTHVQPFSIISPQSCFRETPLDFAHDRLHQLSAQGAPQISAAETHARKGILPFDVGR